MCDFVPCDRIVQRAYCSLAPYLDINGAFHSTKISGNFGLKLNETVRSNRKSFEKIDPPLEVDHFFRLDRSDQNGPFHLTIPTHSQSQYLAVRYFHVQHELTWRKTLSMQLLWIVNSGSIGDTHTSTCSKQQVWSCFASQGYVIC